MSVKHIDYSIRHISLRRQNPLANKLTFNLSSKKKTLKTQRLILASWKFSRRSYPPVVAVLIKRERQQTRSVKRGDEEEKKKGKN